jgi:histidine triad (HIT) family protein
MYNMSDCIFCKIVEGSAKADIVYKDGQVTAFRDLHPVAPTHILIVPNKHIASINDMTKEDEPVLGHMHLVAKEIAQQEGVAAQGYRLIVNTGAHAGQVIFHLHLHVIGGQRMRHPMG